MSYLLWDDFKTIFPRDENKWGTARHFAFCINDTIIWNDCFVEPYNDFFVNGPITFSSVMVDVDGEQKEAVLMDNGIQQYTVLCPEMITAMFLSEPEIIERWIDLDGQAPAPRWKFDRNKQGFPRFYIEDVDLDGRAYRIWGDETKEYLDGS